MAIKQISIIKKVPLARVMRSSQFVRGFNEAKKGKPLNYDAYNDTNPQWYYERGRLFGFVFHGALKSGSKVTWPAIEAMEQAIISGAIF